MVDLVVSEVDLSMAQPLVYAIALLGSFHVRLLFFPHPCFVMATWNLIWYMVSAWFTFSRPYPIWSCLISFLGLSVSLNMVRNRGVSRRGGTTGNRGRASQSAPQNIVLLASASPSSPPFDHGRPFPHNSFQSTRFKFHCRLNKPILSASITVILAEEEGKPSSFVHTIVSQSLDDSVLQGDVVGVMFKDENMQEEGNVPEAPQPPVDSTQRNLPAFKPEHPPGGILNLETPSGGGDMGEVDIAVVTGEGSPSQVERDALNSQAHV